MFRCRNIFFLKLSTRKLTRQINSLHDRVPTISDITHSRHLLDLYCRVLDEARAKWSMNRFVQIIHLCFVFSSLDISVQLYVHLFIVILKY